MGVILEITGLACRRMDECKFRSWQIMFDWMVLYGEGNDYMQLSIRPRQPRDAQIRRPGSGD